MAPPADAQSRVLVVILLVILAILSVWVWRCRRAGRQTARAKQLGPRYGGGKEVDTFPYAHLETDPPERMFERLKNGKITAKKGIQERGRGQNGSPTRYHTVVQRSWEKCSARVDSIADHFTEKIRMRCQTGDERSPWAVWNDDRARLRVVRDADKYLKKYKGASRSLALREAIRGRTRFCNDFNPSLGLWMLRHLARRMGMETRELCVLDPSAGWGSRLIAACAAPVKSYHGYDPNQHLAAAYSQIIAAFRPQNSSACNFWVRTMPFEQAAVAAEAYDIVLTSPPFYNLEVYPGKGASHGSDRTYQQWLTLFYTPYLSQAWGGLRPGGYMALYVSDIQVRKSTGDRQQAPLARDSVDIVRGLGGGVPTYYGYQTLGTTRFWDNPIRPMLVWQKPDSQI